MFVKRTCCHPLAGGKLGGGSGGTVGVGGVGEWHVRCEEVTVLCSNAGGDISVEEVSDEVIRVWVCGVWVVVVVWV